MLMVVKQNLRLLKRYFLFNLQSAMEYKTNFFIQSFGMAINNVAFILFWWILFAKMGNQVGGYEFKQMLRLWAIASSGFGLSHVIFGNQSSITRLIVDGALDTYLLQPKNPLWNLLISKSVITAWGDLAYGIILFMCAVPMTFYNWSFFILFVILAALLFMAVGVITHSLTFYLGRTTFGNLLSEFVLTFCLYPEGIFHGITRFLLYTLLPAGFIIYIPVRILTSFNWVFLVCLLFFDLCFACVAFWFFHRGLKRYESGNLLQARV